MTAFLRSFQNPHDTSLSCLNCLSSKSQKEIDELWVKEAEERVGEPGTSEVKAIPGEDVFREIREKLSERAEVGKLRNFGSSVFPNFSLYP